MNFVLGASVALLWLLPLTNSAGVTYADSVLLALKDSQAVVRSLFALATANVIAKIEGKGLVSEAESQRFIALLGQLDIATDVQTMAHAFGDTLNLARRYRLSAYEAAYLNSPWEWASPWRRSTLILRRRPQRQDSPVSRSFIVASRNATHYEA